MTGIDTLAPGEGCGSERPSRHDGGVKILLRNPTREEHHQGPVRVHRLLELLGIDRESVLVIRNGTLVPSDEELADDDVIEVRPVISGGAQDTRP